MSDTSPSPTAGPDGHRCGFVAVLGLPNAGKSTLVNAFFDRSLCIVSPKPQTTRFQVRCISTTEARQLILVDTPGWHARGKVLGKYMRQEISRSLSGTDVMVYLIDATRLNPHRNRYAMGILRNGVEAPLVLLLNKIDRLKRPQLLSLLDDLYKTYEPDEILPISALTKDNLDELDRTLTALVPEGPRLYPEETVIDKPDEFLFAEFIREQIYLSTEEEVPFSCAVNLESVSREDGRVNIEAFIYVERKSQKGILIGEGGHMIALIRGLATKRIKRFLSEPVTLEIWVKVKPKWATNTDLIDQMGHNR